MKTSNIVVAALFASVQAVQLAESPDCPDSTSVFSYNERVAAAAGLAQKRFATGMNGDEDLGQNIIMKGDKYHYHQAMIQCPPPKSEPGAPPYWKAYEDGPCEAPPKPEPKKEMPLCRGGRYGDIPGSTCRQFVTSTTPGSHGNSMMQLQNYMPVNTAPRGIDGIHDNAAHITTKAGTLPTCMGADSDIPETNCTNRKAPLCNGKGTNGIAGVSCRAPLPMCNGLPGTNGHPGVDCVAPPLPTCGVAYGGQPGIDCKIRFGSELPAPAGAPALVEICNGHNFGNCMTSDEVHRRSEELVQMYTQKQIPTCTDRHTVNCQPVCTESETTGCTESRTPTSYPMRTWDWRDRFEGTKTWDYSTENRPF